MPLPAAARIVVDSAAVLQAFRTPPVEYSTGALWVWNDMLTDQQVRESLRDIASQGLRNAHVHPRPGLMTPYLSEDWFQRWGAALDEAGKLGVRLWIYDENSYPSGFAGGWVPELMPESRGMGLAITEAASAPVWSDEIIAVHRWENGVYRDVTARLKSGEALGDGRFAVAMRTPAKKGPWYANRNYVNLLTPGVTQKFLEVTFEPYRKQFGREFGRTIAGVFTDEPHLRAGSGLPWADDLAGQFQKRWGYGLIESLPSLTLEIGDWRRVRHNFLQLLDELFVERWARPYFDYCEKNGLEATGHYWEHEWPNARSVPDNMTMAAWQHRPGIDTLMNSYSDAPKAQFGNARAAREVASVAAQLGRPRTMVEAFGAAGWDLRFSDMKRIGDWLQVLGVNDFVEHYAAISLRGSRKRDHPQSFSYHEPYWPEFGFVSGYFSRLSAALSQGERPAAVLLIQPTTSAWMYNYGAHSSDALDELGREFHETVNAFEAAQVEYDLGGESVLAAHGSVRGTELVVGRRAYGVVVLPRRMENLNGRTIALLEQYLRAGGVLIAMDDTLSRVDGVISERAAALRGMRGWTRVDAGDAAGWLLARSSDRVAIRRAEGDKGILFHHRRSYADGELVFLVNTSAEHSSSGTVSAAAAGVECWDAETGTSRPWAFAAANGRITASFSLPPTGSVLLFLANSPRSPGAPPSAPRVVRPTGAPEVQRIAPNVLTIDFVDITAGGETRKNVYCYEAGQFAFRQNGATANPWDSSVQFRDELISRTYPATSGFEATYRFLVEGDVPADLEIVIERPDLYTITCNGQPVAAAKGRWWLDRAFGCISLAGVARTGRNEVTVRASPFTQFHELEPAYLRGSFRLRPARRGFVVVPDAPLQLGPWTAQEHPFYAEGVRYRARFDLAKLEGSHAVSLPSWLGSVARVRVNGTPAGLVAWAPWNVDVSRFLRPGTNTIEVDVVGTLKNTLGPHHRNPELGRAWPANFRVSPKHGAPSGKEYSLVGYGLFEPFVLLQSAAAP